MQKAFDAFQDDTLPRFKRFMLEGNQRLAMMELFDFHKKYPDLEGHPVMEQSRGIVGRFLVLNPYAHQDGHIEASNLLSKIDENFKKNGMASLLDQTEILSNAAQNPSFDLGYNHE